MLRKCYGVSRSSSDENNESVSSSWIVFRHWIVAKLTFVAKISTADALAINFSKYAQNPGANGPLTPPYAYVSLSDPTPLPMAVSPSLNTPLWTSYYRPKWQRNSRQSDARSVALASHLVTYRVNPVSQDPLRLLHSVRYRCPPLQLFIPQFSCHSPRSPLEGGLSNVSQRACAVCECRYVDFDADNHCW